MTYIKICGITNEHSLKHCDMRKVDYVGFVFAANSKRVITKEKAKKIITSSKLNHSIPVAVFMGNSTDEINEIVSYCDFGVIQLHNYNTEDIKLIKSTYVLIEACSADKLKPNNIYGDMLLVDGRNPGSGVTFNWSQKIVTEKPYFIAGGLDETNVQTAINIFKPYGVDVSSGVETNGIKDLKKIDSFINKVRGE